MQPLTRVILVRHGRSTFNEQGRYQGSSNEAVLTQKGIETSRLVGKFLKQTSTDTPIDIIYTSPLRRVQQTADEIVKAMATAQRPPIVVSHDLKEISMSHWEGLSYQQVKQQFASQYQCWQHRPDEFELPVRTEAPVAGGIAIATETYFPVQALYREARQFWQKILPRHAGSKLLIVSHSGTIHALISTALGLPPGCHHSLQQSNCGISELTFSHRGGLSQGVQLHQLNQTTALGENLPKLKINKIGLRLLLLASDGLNADRCEHLAERIKTSPIDFCLSVDEGNHGSPHLPIQHHPKILCLGAQKVNFLQAWQQHLHQSHRSSESLITGLAIAPTTSIQNLLRQALETRSEQDSYKSALSNEHLAIHHDCLSVIHYPHGHRPVVQAINI